MQEESDSFQTGMKIRREMFGAAGAEDRLAKVSDFMRPFEETVTRYCFGDTWSRSGLDLRTRSMITLAALTALCRPNQLKVHVHGALKNGVTPVEIREILLHTAVYAGIPCGVEAFNAAEDALSASNL